MKRMIVGASLAGLACLVAYGQTAPAFDVASVKMVKTSNMEKGRLRESIELSGGSLTMRNLTLQKCLEWAYEVKEYQISGPSWLDSELYEITAKAVGPASESEMRSMLQALLAERFRLTLHREPREIPVFALIQGKSSPKLRPSDEKASSGIKVVGSTVTVPHISIAQLTDMLWKQLDRPVLDMTGLTGFFDLQLDVSESESKDGGAGSDRERTMVGAKMMMGRALPQVVQAQLGLKLESRKLPADVLVIDRVERVPVEN